MHQGALNQRIQLLATDLLGAGAMAWEPAAGVEPGSYAESLPYEVKGMLRSRANTIEGGTTEVNKNIVARAGARPAPRARSLAGRAVARHPPELMAPRG